MTIFSLSFPDSTYATLAPPDGVVTDTPSECSHLVMEKLMMSDKMLVCLPLVKHVLSLKWTVSWLVLG